MQITPITQAELLRLHKLGPGDLNQPGYSVRAGTIYLRGMLSRFD